MDDVRALLAAYDAQLRPAEWQHLPPGAHAETDGPVVRVVGLARGFVGAAPDLRISGAPLDALIARQRDFFAARGEAVEWKTRGHDKPPEIIERLVAAGFVAEPTETVVIGRAAPVAGIAAQLPAGVLVRQVTTGTAPADLRRIAELKTEESGEDHAWLADELLGRLRVVPETLAVFVAEGDGELAAAGWLSSEPGTEFAGLWGGVTRQAWRRRGLYRALVVARARHAVAHRVRYLQVDALPTSRPILERLGFVAVTTTTPYVWTPS